MGHLEPAERRRSRGDENQTHWMPVRLHQSEMESEESDVPAGRGLGSYRTEFSERDPCESGGPKILKGSRQVERIYPCRPGNQGKFWERRKSEGRRPHRGKH